MYNVQVIQNERSFGNRALSALGIAIIADALDYFAAPLFGSPIIGDIFDSIVTGMLYSVTKSKSATAINLIEFIPFVGDFVPIYTLSTLYWISKELGKPESERTYYGRPPQPYYIPKRNLAKDLVSKVKRRLIPENTVLYD
jgi:hypothetical protein